MPGTKAVGTKTATRTSAIASSALPTSSIVLCAASFGAMPPAILRSTFSTTTMAASTTMPMASPRPTSRSGLREKPEAGEVLPPQKPTARCRANDDAPELPRIVEPALRRHGELEGAALGDGFLAQRASRHLHILLLDGADDVARRHAESSQLV